MTSSPTSPQVQLALNVLMAYGALDAAKAFSYFSDRYEHEMLPRSMFGGSVKTKAELFPLIEKGLTAFKKLRVR